MKALSFLLSIWILVCAGAPCADGLPDAGHDHAASEMHMPAKDTGGNNGDLCSPFCICYCCAAISVLPKAAAFPIKPLVLAAPESRYLCPPVQDLSDPFWQPPRHA